MGISSNAPSFGKVAVPAFGILFVLFGVTMSIRNYHKAKDYREALHRYQAERKRIRSRS